MTFRTVQFSDNAALVSFHIFLFTIVSNGTLKNTKTVEDMVSVVFDPCSCGI